MRSLSPSTLTTLLEAALPGHSIRVVNEAPYTFSIEGGGNFLIPSYRFLEVFELVPFRPGTSAVQRQSTFYAGILTRELRKQVACSPVVWEYLLSHGE